MSESSVFLRDLRAKAKRKGADLSELLNENDRGKTGRMPLSIFRKLVANTGMYVEDDHFLDMVEPYTKNGQFFYAEFIQDTDGSNTKNDAPRLSDDQLREFGAPLRDRGVQLVDFLRQWDRNRSGRVPTSIFLRNVSSTPLGQIVCRAYTNPVTQDVEYVDLWRDVERVLAAKYSGNPVDPRRMQQVINMVAATVKQRGLDLFAQFEKIDRFKRRRIQPQQFIDVVAPLRVQGVSQQDLIDLCDTFTENAVFDYVSFCDEIDRSNAIQATTKPVVQPQRVNVDDALKRMTKEIINRHSPIVSAMVQLDTDGTGIIPLSRFVRTIQSQGFSLTDQEIDAIAHEFSNGKNGVDMLTFLNVVSPPPEPTVNVEDVLIRMQDHLAARKVQIAPMMKRYDTRGNGLCPFTQFLSILRDVGFNVTNEEENSLKKQLAPGVDGQVQISQIADLVDPIIEQPKPRQPLPKKEFVEPATVVLDVMTRIGVIVSRYQLDLFGDFKHYDPQNTGFIKDTEFTAVISSLPSAPNEKEISALIDFYANRTSHDVNYESFCQEMDEFAISRLQKNPELTSKMMSELPSAPPAAKAILKRLKLHLYTTKIPIDSLFKPFDTTITGLIPASKLAAAFDGCSFRLNDNEISLLIDAFKDQRLPEKISYKRLIGEFNDIRLSQSDLESTQVYNGGNFGLTNAPPQHERTREDPRANYSTTNSSYGTQPPAPTPSQPPPPPSMRQTSDPTVLLFIGELREKLLERHKKVSTPFVGVRSQAMPVRDFRRCVESFGLVIKENNMQRLLREYKMNMQGDIDWQRFVYDVENIKTV